jgi:hypothetical protein
MNKRTPLVIGLCGSLSTIPVLAGDIGKTAVDSAGEAAAGEQTSEDTRASDGGRERTATGETATANKETEASLSGAAKGAKRAASGETKRADTAAAVGYIYDQVKEGNIKIKGVTDAGMVDDD